MTTRKKTSREVAEELGCNPSTVNRWAQREGLGVLVHGVREFAAREVAALRKLIRPGPGNPLMGRDQPEGYVRRGKKKEGN